MLKLLENVKGFMKPPELRTEGVLFRLHCNLTAALLLVCSAVIGAKEMVGTPIECLVPEKKGAVKFVSIPQKPLNTYCWVRSTYTVPGAYGRLVGTEVAHPGVANDFGDMDDVRHHTYYQWVVYALFFQVSRWTITPV